jgi:hypothetical protein
MAGTLPERKNRVKYFSNTPQNATLKRLLDENSLALEQ